MSLVPPSRLKTRHKTYTKQWRRCFWMLLEERTANGLATSQAELTIFLNALTPGDIESLQGILQTARTTRLSNEDVHELLTDLKERYG